MRNKYLTTIILSILGLFIAVGLAKNETSRLAKLSKGADVIVTGKISEKKSDWNENKTRIYTRATLKVDEFIKGKGNGNSVEIIYPGGEVDDVGEIYTHMPTFEQDEEVLVFLKKDDKQNNYRVFQGEEGKIKVINDPGRKEKVNGTNQSIKALKAEIRNILNDQ